MCLIVFAFNFHSEYTVIFAGNRDEFYAREAQKAHFWDTEPSILAGKDLRAGGTWLGVSEKGEFGAITNFRDLDNPLEGDRSRGEIIPGFLTRKKSHKEKLSQLIRESKHYAGFNLLAGSSEQLYYVSNVSGEMHTVSPGIHGISNAFLDTPWPKVEKAKSEFKKAISPNRINRDRIFRFLKNSDTYPEESLPSTGLSPETEKAVSPIFIKTEGYGTRCSTLLTIDKSGKVHFTEKTYPAGDTSSEEIAEFTFKTSS